jgi:hypothetical protein
MKNKIYKLMESIKNKEYKVVRFTESEFELDNGDVYPHLFKLDSDITVDEFQEILNDSKEFMLKFLEDK